MCYFHYFILSVGDNAVLTHAFRKYIKCVRVCEGERGREREGGGSKAGLGAPGEIRQSPKHLTHIMELTSPCAVCSGAAGVRLRACTNSPPISALCLRPPL